MTMIKDLNSKIKIIKVSYEKSSKEINIKILVRLPKVYLEVVTTVEADSTISLKVLKKSVIKFYE